MSRLYTVRGSSAFRTPNRTKKCRYCGAYYNTATDFDAHYKGACLSVPSQSHDSKGPAECLPQK